MSDSNVVLFPPDHRDPRWYADSPVMVRWDARRDPIFVLDLKTNKEHRNPEALVAAHAALDALATFGSMTSPLATVDIEGLDSRSPPGLRDEASWTWVHALRAKRWKHVYVAARP